MRPLPAAPMVAVSSPFRATANLLGLAWWARIDTRNPDVTYWFGPFVRRGSLERELEAFMADLRAEQPGVHLRRCGMAACTCALLPRDAMWLCVCVAQ